MKTKTRATIKKLTGYLMIELLVPGGTLVILGLLLVGGSFPTVQERVLGILPRHLSAKIRPEKSRTDQRKALWFSSTDSDPAAR